MAIVDTESAPAADGQTSLSRLAHGAWVGALIGCALWAPIVWSDLTSLARVSQIMVSDVLGRLATLELLAVLCISLGLLIASLIPLLTLPRSAGLEVGQRAVWLAMIAGSTAVAWVAPRALARGLLAAAPTPARLLVLGGAVFVGAAMCGFVALRSSARRSRLLGLAGLLAWALHWLVWPRISTIHLVAVAIGAAGVAAVPFWKTMLPKRAFLVVGSSVLASSLICALAQPPIDRPTEAGPRASTPGPNVVVFVADTQRWDRTSLGARSETTPNLASLASDPWTTSFTSASAGASATIPSVKSLFTARAPSTWGLDSAGWKPPPAAAWTLARAFSDRGYSTSALSTNGLLRGEGFETGFERVWVASGFDIYLRSFILGNLLSVGDHWHAMRTLARKRLHKVDGEDVLAQFDEWMRSADPRPKFFYVHIIEPHWPYYDHGRGFGSRVEPSRRLTHVDLHLLGKQGTATMRDDTAEFLDLTGRYEEELFEADLLLGKLLGILEITGTDRDTLLVVTADHGEEFLDHGRFSHGFDVFEEQIHVPLVIRWPHWPEFSAMPRRIETAVSLLDLLPTLSELLELARPTQQFDGESLAGLLRGESEHGPVIAESFEGTTWRASVREGDYKARLVFSATLSPLDTTEAEVFDLASDPNEERPLEVWNEEIIDLVRRARVILDARWQRWPDRRARSSRGSDDDALDGLRDLGYLQ